MANIIEYCSPVARRSTTAISDVESVARLLEGRSRDDRNPVAAQVDKAFARQLAERLSRNRAADAEAFAERILGQLVAGRQRPLDDRPADDGTDPVHAAGGILLRRHGRSCD
ncbi:hypothetical protein GGR03_004244 [Aurantimonas endophytica]|uniref:Uncharacterized protein n=1 Tax=Aurantimonas endophytica TaxID=1522175 RepID=A0A7W6MRH8_9HYPH|nr:hypothetical protein [Aurantimonas endophytica]MBB4005145.1 hypothetical protein [Aurantimonas endophytica]